MFISITGIKKRSNKKGSQDKALVPAVAEKRKLPSPGYDSQRHALFFESLRFCPLSPRNYYCKNETDCRKLTPAKRVNSIGCS